MNQRKFLFPAAILMIAVVGFVPGLAAAAPVVVDLTAGAAGNGSIDGTLFEFGASATGTGTGTFPAFVRVQASGTEKGYNTSARPVAFDEKTDLVHTHDLQLSDLGIVDREGTFYYEFRLDMQESQGGGNEYLSLDALKIYTNASNFSDGSNPGDISLLGDLRYDMDGSDPGNVVLMNSGLAPGQGKPDIVVLVPTAKFSLDLEDDYLFFYTEFGGEGTVSGRKYGSSSAFEEWSFTASESFTPPQVGVPEPATLALLGIGSAGLVTVQLRRRKLARAAA